MQYANDEERAAVDDDVAQQATMTNVLFSQGVMVACWVFALLFGLHALLLPSRLGRELLANLVYLINRFFLAFVLILCSILYTPITKQLLSVFLCEQQACQRGDWYPKSAKSWESAFFAAASFEARARGECEPCKFLTYPSTNRSSPVWQADASALLPTYGASCPAFPEVCSGETIDVLQQDHTMLCDESQAFYIVASLLMLVGFTCIVPYLFYTLTTTHTRVLKDIYIEPARLDTCVVQTPAPLYARLLCCRWTDGASPEDIAWDYRVLRTRNRAKTLYEHFEWRFRYFRLVLLLYKLVLVCVVLFLARRSATAASVLSAFMHLCFFIISITQQPYFNPASDALSSAAAFANTVNAGLLTAAYYGSLDNLSSNGAAVLIVGCNFGLPLLCLFVGIYYACRKRDKLWAIVRQLEAGMSMEEYSKVTRDRKRIDVTLERETTKIIASTFMTMVICAFTAFTFIFVSYIYVAAQGDVVQATPPTLGYTYVKVQGRPACEMETALADVEFLFMGNWAAFTSMCCCRDSYWDNRLENETAAQVYGANASQYSSDLGRTELWTCPDWSPENGTSSSTGILHKLRSRVNDTHSGLGMRPFCSTEMAHGVLPPSFDDDLLAYVALYANGSGVAGAAMW